jgi:LysM repeat protein
VKKKLFLIAATATLSLLLVYPTYKEYMHQKTEKFYTETYVVQPGDTLWSIAGEYNQQGKDVRKLIYDIRKINDITPVINPGQVLEIPVKEIKQE